MNPFKKSPSPLRPRDQRRWVCMQESQNKLAELVERGENAVILGVEGSGKTTLINLFFTPEYCAQSVENGKLIFFADLSMTDDVNDLCSYLTRRLEAAVAKHLPGEDRLALEQFLVKNREESAKRQFILTCECLFDQGYTLLLVMDGFERFVSSPHITQDQHDMLRSLLEKDILRCVVATNYDLEKTSLPKDIQGSLYLQKFQQKVTMTGFSLEEATAFVEKRIPASDPVQLDPKKIKFLHTLTGGIPHLFEMAASHMYDLLERNIVIKSGEMKVILYNAAKTTMERWFKFFTPEYDAVISTAISAFPDNKAVQMFQFPLDNEKNYNAASRLRDRGFWVNSQRNTTDKFAFNSLLLQMYTANQFSERAEKAAQTPATVEETPKPRQKNYNVFISYKRTDNKLPTRDSEIALDLYETLQKVDGIVPFLDVKESPYGIGHSNFTMTILGALATTQAFVYICTKGTYLTTPWVQMEWSRYFGAMVSGKKPHDSIYGVVEDTDIDDLPMELSTNVEIFPYTPADLQRLVVYLRSQLLG